MASRHRMTRHFCTYFDHRYLARGLALRESLLRHAPGHVLWILCLSKECEDWFRSQALPGVEVIPLADLEAWDPELFATRGTRSNVEYYFTCSPCLPRYVFGTRADVEAITYLDSDLYFFSSPEAVFDEIGDAAVAIVPHRFEPSRAAELEAYGRFNVGWLSFTRSHDAFSCLDWWRERCLDWCYDRLEPGRFADQKYLDEFPSRFGSVHVVEHPGANLAPWNLARHMVSAGPASAGRPVVFYHFHGLKRRMGGVFDMHLETYGVQPSRAIRRYLYEPYLRALSRAQSIVDASNAIGTDSQPLRGPQIRNWRSGLSDWLSLARAALTGNLVYARSTDDSSAGR
jgi:hypothetical protein